MYNTKNKTQKAYKKNKPNLNLVPKNCVCVFPVEIVGGKTLVSNQGIMPNRKYYDKGSFLYWQEVFDGRSALKLQWEDSITLEKPEGKNYYLAKPSIGKYYYGKPISSGSEALEISEDASFEEFMSIKASQSVTLRFEYDPTNRTESWYNLQEKFRFTLIDNDIYNLYIIPELCEEKLLYISEYNEYYDDLTGLTKGCEITFATLGDKLQKTGKAIEQYCSWSAPGEFAIKPKVWEYFDYEAQEWVKEVVISPQELYYPTPVKYLQIEQQGPALTSSMYALGRKQEWDETEQCWKIGPSQILLPYKFIVTQPNPLNRTSTPTKNFDLFTNEQVSMIVQNEWLKWRHDTSGQPLEQQKNSGMITIGAKNTWTNLDTGIHKSNPIQANGTRYDYFSETWFPIAQLGDSDVQFDTTGSVYATDTMELKTTDDMITIFCKNAFIFNQQPIIPLSMAATRPFYLRDIPLIGAIANFFKIGDIHLSHHTTNRVASHLCFFGDADVMGMCANLNGQIKEIGEQDKLVFPINFFGTNETQYQRLGVNAVNTTFCFELTDTINENLDGTEQNYNTIYLAQSKDENGNWLRAGHTPVLVNGTMKPVKTQQNGFIIDAIVVQSIFDGKIKLSCYGPEEENFIYPQWTATILSNANWQNGNMRDWTNLFLLSNWEERFCIQEDEFTWPQQPYKPETGKNVEVDIGLQSVMELKPDKYFADYDNSWSLSLGRLEKQPGSYCQRTKNFTESRTIPYTDLGVASVTDRDTFIAYFKDLLINFDGSTFKEWYNEGGQELNNVANVQLKSKKIGEFVSGTYSYTFTISPLGVSGCSGGPDPIDIPTPGAWFHTREGKGTSPYRLFSLSGKLESVFNAAIFAYQQEAQITITLDSNITVSCVDKSKLINPAFGSRGDNVVGKKMGYSGWRATEPFQALSTLILKSLTFNWRGN